MSIGAAPFTVFQPAPAIPMRRFTVDEYHRMIATGILHEGDPVELLEGWLVLKMTRNPPHDVALSLTDDEISKRLTPELFCRIQMAITTPESEPEPDVAVVRGPRRRYAVRHPEPHEVLMLVEVADASLEMDRNDKGRVYARVNIPIYWIVNIRESCVEVYTDPSGPDNQPAYLQRRDYGPAENVPLVLNGVEVGQIPVRDLLP